MNPKMRNAELVRVLEGLGFGEVRAVISSGNVLFSTDDGTGAGAGLEARIEGALLDHLGSPCSTIVRTRRQIDLLLGSHAFDGREDVPGARWNVTFLKRRPPAGIELPSCGPGAELLAVERQAILMVVDHERQPVPDVMRVIERTYGKETTTRTWQTVHRIASAFSDER